MRHFILKGNRYMTLGSRRKLLRKLFIESGGLCAFCGDPMTRFRGNEPGIYVRLRPTDATLEHLTPRSRGGLDSADNLTLVHSKCNRIKGNLTLIEFLRTLLVLCQLPAPIVEDKPKFGKQRMALPALRDDGGRVIRDRAGLTIQYQ